MLRLELTSDTEFAPVLRGCFFAVTLLLFLCSLAGRSVVTQIHGSGVGVSVDCADHDDDHGAPPLTRRVHCCILCDCPGLLGGARAPAGAEPDRMPPEARASGPRAAIDFVGVARRPPGWASSWSSQAPPIVG